jgi:hypothetical protein
MGFKIATVKEKIKMKAAKEIIETYRNKIRSTKDVRAFFTALNEHGPSNRFHPDKHFNDYKMKGNQLFTHREAYDLDKILGDCFFVCEKNATDIYEISNEIFKPESGRRISKIPSR